MPSTTSVAQRPGKAGLIVADTKFEFGLCEGELILIDEAFTPDSSRYWDIDSYEPGHPQPSYDKEFVRDWLRQSGWNMEPPAPMLPDDIIQKPAPSTKKPCAASRRFPQSS